jgi:hypothetical protein
MPYSGCYNAKIMIQNVVQLCSFYGIPHALQWLLQRKNYDTECSAVVFVVWDPT